MCFNLPLEPPVKLLPGGMPQQLFDINQFWDQVETNSRGDITKTAMWCNEWNMIVLTVTVATWVNDQAYDQFMISGISPQFDWAPWILGCSKREDGHAFNSEALKVHCAVGDSEDCSRPTTESDILEALGCTNVNMLKVNYVFAKFLKVCFALVRATIPLRPYPLKI